MRSTIMWTHMKNHWDYTYSSQNQLATVKDETNSTVAVYKYDALGRRYKKAVGANSTYFLYDTQGRIIAQYTSTTTNTAPDRWFVHGNGFQPLAMLREPDNTAGLNHLAAFIETWLAGTGNGGYNTGHDFDSSGFVDMNDLDIMADLYDFEITHPSAYYYLRDALGSTMGLLTDYPKADDWNEFYRYDAWGNILDGSDVDNHFLWAGYYHDEETNDYYCNNRYYKPTLARWTQNDPLGTNPDGFLWNTFNADGQYKDSVNGYDYVKDNPINGYDPYGLLWNLSRKGMYRATAEVFILPSSIYSLSGLAKLDPDEFKYWMKLTESKIETITGLKSLKELKKNDMICPGQKVTVPNTFMIVIGEMEQPARSLQEDNAIAVMTALLDRGFYVKLFDRNMWLVTVEDIASYPKQNVWGIGLFGHGFFFPGAESNGLMMLGEDEEGSDLIITHSAFGLGGEPLFKYGGFIGAMCFSGFGNWEDMVYGYSYTANSFYSALSGPRNLGYWWTWNGLVEEMTGVNSNAKD